MNLKEAFRFQNKLQELMQEAMMILSDEDNTTTLTKTYLRKKAIHHKQAQAFEKLVFKLPTLCRIQNSRDKQHLSRRLQPAAHHTNRINREAL